MDDEEEQQSRTIESMAPPPPTPVQMNMIDYCAEGSLLKLNSSTNLKESIDDFSNQTNRLINNNSFLINLNDIKPASRFSLHSRRECKSTSDEPNTQIIQSNNSPKGSTQISLDSKANEINKNDWLMTNICSLNAGKFGFHVSNLNKMTTHLFHSHNHNHHRHYNHQSKLSSKTNNEKFTGIYNNKRGVKRLATSNKFFMNKLNDKKHLDGNLVSKHI
jgi:hypothetical protein